ncbi:hypothetical protein [Methanolobus profundi]|uniref:Uncharacterized protein n=1 Tax=Methanolobus profundi TaxID=487685 RepID=A0A1I4P6M1_9EURY|nr:hypothetical protein [Methanolobus profundi]SFM23458.1 hypothetical protein SAMN04488696_0480 [Methanolobus profundi]
MNQKYAALFLAALMVMSVFSYFVASFVGDSDTDEELADIADAPGFEVIDGTHFDAEIDSVSDGLAFTPEGVSNAIYVDYSRTYGTPLQDYNVSDLYAYYNTMMIRRFSAYNITSNFGFEAHVLNPETVGFNYAVTDTYNGYSILSRGSGIFNVIGTPTLLGDQATLEKVIDVRSGTSPASSDFTEILGYVEPGAEYQVVTSVDPLAEQHYLEFRNMNDGNYSKTEIFLDPVEGTVENIESLEVNSTDRGLFYNTSTFDDGRIVKVVVTTNTSNFLNLITEQYY